MFNMIDKYMQSITKDDVNNFAKSKNITLSESELNFTYTFVKKNYKEMLKNPNLFKIDRYKDHYQGNNFEKIKKVYIDYFSKYQRFL